MGASVGPDPNHLENIRRFLGRTEGKQVVRVVGTPVAIEGRQHRHHRMCRRQRPMITACAGRRERPGRELPAWLDVPANPVRGRHPCEEKRHLNGIGAGIVDPTLIDGQRCLGFAAQVVDQADPPGEVRRERLPAGGSPLEAGHRLVPIALDLLRLSLQLVDLGRPELSWDCAARAEDGGDLTGCQQLRAIPGDDRGERLPGTCREQHLHGVRPRTGLCQPCAGCHSKLPRLGLAHRKRFDRVVTDQRSERERPIRPALDEETLS